MELIAKAAASVAMSLAVAIVGYRTKEPVCLWALLLVAHIW